MSANKRFGSLLSAPPKPLPDDDEVPEQGTIAVQPEPEPALVVIPQVREEPALVGEPEPQVDRGDPEPVPAPAAVVVAAAPSIEPNGAAAQPAEQPAAQPAPRVPLTVRLHAPAARALRDAWLGERRTGDPTLSSPTFASEIVMLGLAAYNQKGS